MVCCYCTGGAQDWTRSTRRASALLPDNTHTHTNSCTASLYLLSCCVTDVHWSQVFGLRVWVCPSQWVDWSDRHLLMCTDDIASKCCMSTVAFYSCVILCYFVVMLNSTWFYNEFGQENSMKHRLCSLDPKIYSPGSLSLVSVSVCLSQIPFQTNWRASCFYVNPRLNDLLHEHKCKIFFAIPLNKHVWSS